jgi:hypothetical protein
VCQIFIQKLARRELSQVIRNNQAITSIVALTYIVAAKDVVLRS